MCGQCVGCALEEELEAEADVDDSAAAAAVVFARAASHGANSARLSFAATLGASLCGAGCRDGKEGGGGRDMSGGVKVEE